MFKPTGNSKKTQYKILYKDTKPIENIIHIFVQF